MAMTAQAAHADPAVAGAQSSGDSLFPNQGNGGYDVSHYDVDLSYATGGSISATATIAATTTATAVSSFSLDLEGLTVSSVTVDGTPAGFTRVDDSSGTSTHKLVITPAAPVDGDFTTVVAYSGTPVQHVDPDGSTEGWTPTAKGAVGLGRLVGTMTWLPCNDTPADKASMTTRLRIPATGPANAAVGTGKLKSKTTSGGITTWTWAEAQDESPQAALVAIGTYTQVSGNISVDFDSRSVPQWTYLSPSAAADSTTTTNRGKLQDVLDAIGSRFGSYPGDAVGLVVDDTSLGYSVATQDRPYFEKTVGLHDLIQQLTHQWFGDSASAGDWNDVWLDEGVADFIATEIQHDLDPSSPTTTAPYYGAWSKTAAGSPLWSVAPAHMTDPAQVFGWATRVRAAMAMEALRTTVGDATFYELLDDWVEDEAGLSPTTSDFITYAEAATGRDLDTFFQDWLYDTDKPKWPGSYDLDLVSNPVNGTTVTPTAARTYTMKATNTGKAALTGGQVDVDLTDAFAAPGTLPAGLTQDSSDPDTLHWTVPTTAIGATSSVTFTLTGLATHTARESFVRIKPVGIGGDCGTCQSMVDVEPPLPQISGDARVGRTLTAGFPGFDPGQEFHYEWLRDGTTAIGTDSASYLVQAADTGHTIRVRVTATMSGGAPAVVAASDDTASVVGLEPSATPTPTITGTAKVGQPLTAHPGTWDDGTTVSYVWRRNGNAIPGATRAAYRLTPADRGKRLTLAVTGARPGFETVTVTSAATRPVAAGTQVRRPTVVIKGRAMVGRSLRALTGAHDPGSRLTFRWIVGNRAIPGVHGRRLKLVGSYAGKRVVVVITATKPGYTSVGATSLPTTAVQPRG